MATLTLTDGEKLCIQRRREGRTQEYMAFVNRIHRNTYNRQEKMANVVMLTVPDPKDLTDNEKCFLLRRRAELTQTDLGEITGFSRFWINQMEIGEADCSPLSSYWKL